MGIDDQNQALRLQSMEIKKQLEQSQLDFQLLVKEGTLPPKMEIKLHYLSAAVSGRQIDPKLIQGLPEFQKLSLQMMNIEAKITLFCSIVKCLAGREVVVYFNAERVYFKKENSDARSVTCYTTCNNNHLIVSRNKENTDVWFSFLIERLLVAKLYHREKKKFYFPIVYDNVKYRFKFDQEGPCARIHGALLTAIREKKSLKARSDTKSSFGESRMREELEAEYWDETGQERILDEQRQYLLSLTQRINSSELHKNEDFQLLKNVDGGKVMVNRNKSMVKILLFLEKCTVQGLVQSYINFDSWNIHVDSFKIIKKMRNNTYVGHLKLKKKNFFTAARSAYFVISYFKMCHCLNNKKPEMSSTKHYLLITTMKQKDIENNGSEGVSMDFNQLVQFSQVQGRAGVVFVNILSHIDFNVYQLLQNTLELNLQFNEEISSIGVLCHERAMMKEHKTQLFDFGICVCDRKKVRQHLSLPGHKNGSMKDPRKQSMISELTEDQESSITLEQSVERSPVLPRKQLLQAIQDSNNMKINEKIVDVIRTKIYQRYYLKEKFPFQPNQKGYIQSEFHLKERKNFLMLDKKWKLTKSQDYIFIDEQQLQLQKGILKLIVKQITSNLMAGKSIMSMSLPVQIFDDYSTLEGFSWTFGFIPAFMHKALKETDIEEQIKYVAIPFIFMFACNPKVSKPFNPILGETCQCTIGGIPFYMEQISHHPPISAFFMKTDKFEVSGTIDVLVDVGLNSAHTKIPSPFKVKIYQNSTQYIIRMSDIDLSGIMFGDRNLYLSGRGYVLQKKSGTYLEYSIGKDKKKLYEYKQKIRKPDLAGGVFKITRQAVERILAIDPKKTVEGIRHDQAIERCSLITGKWYGDIFFDGVCYKTMKQGPFPVEIQRPTLVLPSDCTFRLDIVYRRWRNFKKSNEEKEVLENMQRRDRRLREKHHPPSH